MQDIIKMVRSGGDAGIKYPLPQTDRRMSAYDRIEALPQGRRRKVAVTDLSQFRRPTGRRIKNTEHTAAMALRMKHGGKFRPIQIQVVPGIKDVQVIDGAHRLEAARMIGARRIPVVVATPDQEMHRIYTGKDRLVANHERRRALEMQSMPKRLYSHQELKYLAARAPQKGSWEHRVNELLARHAVDYDISPADYRIQRRKKPALQEEVPEMPYASAKQRAFMHATDDPEINAVAHEWDEKYGGKVKSHKKVRKYDDLLPVVEEVDKGLYGAFKQKEKKNRDLRAQKTPYGYGEQHNTWVRKARTSYRSKEEQERHDKRKKAALIGAGVAGGGLAAAGGLGYLAHRRGFRPIGREVASGIPGIEGYKMTRGAQASANARAFGQSLKSGLKAPSPIESWDEGLKELMKPKPAVEGIAEQQARLAREAIEAHMFGAPRKPMSPMAQRVNRAIMSPYFIPGSMAVGAGLTGVGVGMDVFGEGRRQRKEEDRKAARRRRLEEAADAEEAEETSKSLFGSHSARPGSHERGQHGKTALRVSPDERATLAVLGAGAAGLGGAAVAGGYRPDFKRHAGVIHAGSRNGKSIYLDLGNRSPAEIAQNNLRSMGIGLKRVGDQAVANPAVAIGTLVGAASTGTAIYQGVRRYSRRKEKDLPYKAAEKHIRRLENMEGKSPELERALEGMRNNANKQVRGMPRAALEELNQFGYKYGYANSGRYDRAYGPFPVKEPGIQEAADYRGKKFKKSYDDTMEIAKRLTRERRRQIEEPYDPEDVKEARRVMRRMKIARAAGATLGGVAGSAAGFVGTVAPVAARLPKDADATTGQVLATLGGTTAGGALGALAGAKRGQKAYLRSGVKHDRINPITAEAATDYLNFDPRIANARATHAGSRLTSDKWAEDWAYSKLLSEVSRSTPEKMDRNWGRY